MENAAVSIKDRISGAAETIIKKRPDYAPMLRLYSRIFIEQEESKKDLKLNEFTISDDLLRTKQKEGFPLVDHSRFEIDFIQSEKLLKKLCSLFSESESEYAFSAERVLKAVEDGTIDIGRFITAYLRDDGPAINDLMEQISAESGHFALLLYNSIKPSLMTFAEKTSPLLDEGISRERGICPICGSAPALSVFLKDGNRSLVCSFCWHQWKTSRITCHHCGNTDHESLKYYAVEDEEEYRIDVCEKCKNYIKTVDSRNADRYIYPSLEYVSTPHLDIKITEMGYAGDDHTA